MPLILGTNSIKDTSYDVANSLRFNSGSSDNLTRTQTNDSSNTKFNFSVWIKRSKLGTSQVLYATQSGSDEARVEFNTSDELFWYKYNGSSFQWSLKTNRKFRDTSNWFHINLKYDSTQGTSSNRLKMYINGVEETSFSQSGYPSSSENSNFFQGATAYLGCSENTAGFFDGYMAEYVILQGQALDQTSFGEFDSDSPTIWKPKDPSSLTFGTNGFYLDFEDSSALGNDAAGSNNFTVNNLTAIDQCTDTCTNNFATFTSENHTAGNFTLSEGNLKVTTTSGQKGLHGTSIMPTDSGKWYFEVKIDDGAPGDGSRVGIMNYQTQLNNSSYTGVINTPQQVLAGCTTSCKSAKHFEGDAQGVMVEYTSSGDFADGNIVQFAMDLDNKAIYIGRNGTFLTRTGSSGGDPTSGSSKTGAITTNTNIMDGSPMTAYTGISIGGGGSADHEMSFNFGNPPFAISSGNSDSNGFGNFEHAVPEGYYAWCSKNIAEFG